MLRRRNASASTSATDETDETSTGLSYGLGAGEDGELDEDAQYDEDTQYDEDDEYTEGDGEEDEYDEDAEDAEGEYDEDAEGEYDEDAEGEYDEDAEYSDGTYDEDDEYYDEDGDTDESEEQFTPPTAASALKRSWLAPRPRAQPATGTAADAKRVNYLDKRETWIGYFLGVMLVALAVTSYYFDRHYVDKKDLALQNEIHHEAPWILVITLVLAIFILVATRFKRRAAVGFALLLAGVALFNSDFLIGIIYLGTGLWLVFRAMRRNPKVQPATAGGGRAGAAARGGGRGAARGGRSTASPDTSSSSAANPPRVSSSATRATSTGSSGRQIGRNGRLANGGQATGRYTKPKTTRYVAPKAQPEPEPTNRLSAWLKK